MSEATDNAFERTHWSVILAVSQQGSARHEEARTYLCRTYWEPLRAFIRWQGYGPQDAEDLTQAFFAHVFAHNGFPTLDPNRGRFRTYLLASVRHFLTDQRKHTQATRRGGGETVLSLEATGMADTVAGPERGIPGADAEFDRLWAVHLLDQALAQLRSELETGAKGAWFPELRGYLSRPGTAEDYARLATRWDTTAGAVRMMVHRFRKRYGELVREAVRRTVVSPSEVEPELQCLLSRLLENPP